jgi:hypothetical protein
MLLLLMSTLLIACLPLLILVEYIFESTNSQTIILGGVTYYPPVYYLEKLESYSKYFYSNAAIFLAKTINYVYLLDIPMYLLRLWNCIKKVTKLVFKTVMPLEDFRSNFLTSLNPSLNPSLNTNLTRSKRQRSLNMRDENENMRDEDMLNSTIFANLNEQKKEILERLQTPSTREVDEKTREEIEEFTEEADNHTLKGTNIDSSTNVFGMDKIYRFGDVDPAVNPSDAHDDIIRKGLNNKYSSGNPHDDIRGLRRGLEDAIKDGTELNQKMPDILLKEVEESHDKFLRPYLDVSDDRR